jgi:lysophospholipase L1-like esterase
MNEQMQAYQKIEKANKLECYRQLNTFVKKDEILFTGSSLAEQFPINELLPDRTIYNRGVGGFVIDEFLENIDTLIFNLEPSKLFINIGSNDLGLPTYNQDVLMAKYQKVLDLIHDKLPQCQVYILSYYPVNADKKSFIPDEEKAFIFATRTNASINKANKALSLLASKNNAQYIDVNTCLLDNSDTLFEDYTVEGIHLWPKAYARVLEVLVPYLNV